MTFESVYSLGDRVQIDQEQAITGVVVAIRFYTPVAEYLISWFTNGDIRHEWMPTWRINKKQ